MNRDTPRARPLAGRRSFAALDPPTVAEAAADVARARETVRRLRAEIGRRRAGAASLTAAEHALSVALTRFDRAQAEEDPRTAKIDANPDPEGRRDVRG